ncbi:MAG: PQQ-dependent sugar dehydrogenase, partial [Planctomycetales bacterium]|nr:PQQ-dependent sugar dehydrogenase [Planctomycetales bacterium]
MRLRANHAAPERGRRTLHIEPLEARRVLDAGPYSLDGFVDEAVIDSGVALATSLAFFPDGRMLVLQKDGKIWIADPNTGAKSVYMQLTNIDRSSERGLLDIALAPNFDPSAPGDDFFYVYYTPLAPQFARIARFQHVENGGGLTSRGALSSELEIWRDTDGYLTCCHYGGGLDFGPDGKLWLTSSDKFTAPTPGEGGPDDNLSQDLTKAGGKIIRVNTDGSVPDGSDGWPANPFTDPVDDDPNLPGAQDYYDYIWSYGLRNPFRARWDLQSGRFYVAEVGGNQHLLSHEDLHVATLSDGGSNYGWPYYEGTPRVEVLDPTGPYAPPHGFDPFDVVDPVFSYAHNGLGASITGGEVYHGNQFPAEWQGAYFFGDYTNDFLRYVTFDEQGNPTGDFPFEPTTSIANTPHQVVFVGVGVDGAVYYIELLGDVRRVKHVSANQAPQILSVDADRLVGQAPLTVAFSATVADPEDDSLTYAWHFGDQTVAIGATINGTANATKSYAQAGVYSAYLEVSDPSHSSVSQVFTVLVGDVNLPPQIVAIDASPRLGAPPLVSQFSAQVSDPNFEPLSYTWFFGDGTTSNPAAVPPSGVITTLHTYSVAGAYDAYLSVTDGVHVATEFAPTVTVGVVSEPPISSGLALHLESDIKVAVSSGTNVSAWLDGSGNGNNLTAAGDPQIVFDATPGGQPAVVFDGDGDRVSRSASAVINALPTGAQDRTVLMAANYVNPSSQAVGFAFGGSADNEAFGLGVSAATGDFAVLEGGSESELASSRLGIGVGWGVQAVVVEGDQYSHYYNGLLIDSGQHVFQTDLSALTSRIVIGEAIDGSGFGSLEVGAVLVYDRALSAIELQQVEEYLYQKYIVGNVPPLAGDDVAWAAPGASLAIDAFANDVDIDGVINPASFEIATPPAHGKLVYDASFDRLVYQHDGSAGVWDEFSYFVADETGAVSNEARVVIHIGAGNLLEESLSVLLESDAGVGLAGNQALSWLDSSGNGNDLQSAIGSPQWVAHATPSEMPAILFDGDDALLRIDAIDPLNNLPQADASRTLTIVVKYDAPGPAVEYGGSGVGAGFGMGTAAPNGEFQATLGEGAAYVAPATSDTDGWLVETLIVTGSELRHFANGRLIDRRQVEIDTGLEQFVVGRNLLGDQYGRVEVAAVAAYDRALAENERQQIEAHLYAKYLTTPNVDALPGSPSLFLDAQGVLEVDDEGRVAQWRDASPLGNDVFADALGAPQILAGATPNGSDAISFDGIDDRLQRTYADGLSGLPDVNGSRTIFLVVQFHGSNGFGGVLFGDRFNNQLYGIAAAPADSATGKLTVRGFGAANDLVSPTLVFDPVTGETTGWALVSAVHINDGANPAANSFLYYDGQLAASFSHQYNTDVHNSTALLTVGQDLGGLDNVRMELAAAVVYDAALDNTSRLEVEDYLRRRYLGINEPPVFESPSAWSAQEHSDASLTLVASDPNDDDISYTIVGGADAALFTLEGSQGSRLRLSAPADFETPLDADADNVYEVRVSASDGVLSVEREFYLSIVDFTIRGEGSVVEGDAYLLEVDNFVDSATVPGAVVAIDWGDGGPLSVVDASALPTQSSHIYDDETATPDRRIRAWLVDESEMTEVASLDLIVTGAAPQVLAVFAAPVAEGSDGLIHVVNAIDSSPADVDAGFTFNFDFDDDGVFDLLAFPERIAVVPAAYLADDGLVNVRGAIVDKDGVASEFFVPIEVVNAPPALSEIDGGSAEPASEFVRSVTFVDPGSDAPWIVEVDWDGDLVVDETFATADREFVVSHVYTAEQAQQTFQATVRVSDGDGGSDSSTFAVDVLPASFRVINHRSLDAGYRLEFNHPLDTASLNLYGSTLPGEQPAAADFELRNSNSEIVPGSLRLLSGARVLEFYATDGVLPRDVYSVRLASRADGFVDDAGALLDGNSDGIPGDDFTFQFEALDQIAELSLADFARGPGQPIDLT